ncbi:MULTISPECIES: glycosyl transferase [unclassified Microbacterium]|uniref:glycosyl transferase n=1 Tax=unclassified Microbacterium TaxID=2609290 RepID=UPI003018F6B9
MSARVHAVLVARSGSTSLARLLRALDALAAQTRQPDALTIVACGSSTALRGSARVAQAAEAVIETRASTTLAAAVALALPRVADDAALWILTEDCAPAPAALEQLAGALERSPAASIAAPKLLSDVDEHRIASFGQSMTRLGRAVDPARGELDQGQLDGQDDTLGADVRGLLVRAGRGLRPDPGLGGRDEGLDLGIRARLAGGRIVLAAGARIAVDDAGGEGTASDAFARRRAQLHRRLSYAPAVAVPLHWLSLLPLALWRSITHLTGKRPAAVLPEWGAAGVAMVSGSVVARSRRAIRASRSASWASIAPLRTTRAQLRERLDDGHGTDAGVHEELGFFSGGGAWAVLAALVAGVALFVSLLAWPALGGGALLPMRQTVAALWRDAAYGQRGFGVDVVGPADPFSGVLAVLGSLWPGAPSYALVLLWVAALPLAMLGGWFAATRITDRAGLRILAGAVWALAPTFLIALSEGRPAAVLLHLLLPWVFHTALAAHRSWGAAGAASLVTAASLACSPSLAPAFVLLWLIGIVWLLARRSVRGAVRMVWILVPAVVVFAPLAIWQATRGSLWALLSDPGAIVAAPQAAADPAGRLALLGGLPTMDEAGWPALLHVQGGAPWVLWLAAPLGLLALVSTITRRWSVGVGSLLVAASGLATAFGVVGIAVAFAQSQTVPIWPGSALSLAWIGALGGALVTLDCAITRPLWRGLAVAVTVAGIVVCAVPTGVALVTGQAAIHRGELTTLPAYVNAQARADRELGTLVLTAQPGGELATTVVWGESATLGAQATMITTADTPQGADLTELSVDLVSARQFDAPKALGALGVRFVLLEPAQGKETSAARSLRLQSATALDQRAGFVRVGETPRGVLWRMEAEPAARPGPSVGQRATAQLVVTVELIVLLAALLLSIPTRASRRAARAVPRAVGVLPERAPRPVKPERERKARPSRKAKAAAPSLVIPVSALETSTAATPETASAPETEPAAAPAPETAADPASEATSAANEAEAQVPEHPTADAAEAQFPEDPTADASETQPSAPAADADGDSAAPTEHESAAPLEQESAPAKEAEER